MTITEVLSWLDFNGYLYTINRDKPKPEEVYSNRRLTISEDSDYAMGYPPNPKHKLEINKGKI